MYKKVAIENPMSMGGFTGGVRGGGVKPLRESL